MTPWLFRHDRYAERPVGRDEPDGPLLLEDLPVEDVLVGADPAAFGRVVEGLLTAAGDPPPHAANVSA